MLLIINVLEVDYITQNRWLEMANHRDRMRFAFSFAAAIAANIISKNADQPDAISAKVKGSTHTSGSTSIQSLAPQFNLLCGR